MTAHVLIPALDDARPATLSPAIVGQMLKRELGFDGLVLSDDLEMKAISDRYPPGEAAAGAIAAGCDAFLVCGPDSEKHVQAIEGIIRAVEAGQLPLERIEDALARHRRVKERFLGGAAAQADGARLRDILGRGEHRAVAEEMARFV
jgi:beta-N-acetylhexosaminidase